MVLSAMPAPAVAAPADARLVRGVTVSCQTWGPEWGTDGFGVELDRLAELGANWVAIHPYADIDADGTVRSPYDPANPPAWLVRPVREARQRGLAIFVTPHLAYWGSPFNWPGEIDFAGPAARARFHATYRRFIVDLARITRGADAFAVGTELDRLTGDDAQWRGHIAAVRAVAPARLTYAANWTDFERVPWLGALDDVRISRRARNPGDPDEPDVVALVDFTGRRTGDAVTLRWRTAAELHCGAFAVLRCAAAREGACDGEVRVAMAERATVPCRDEATGAEYEVVDADAAGDMPWLYVLREYETTGAVHHYGPLQLATGATRAAWSPGADAAVPPAHDTAPAPGLEGPGGCASAHGRAGGVALLLSLALLALVRRGTRRG
jgi:hypothetical protein